MYYLSNLTKSNFNVFVDFLSLYQENKNKKIFYKVFQETDRQILNLYSFFAKNINFIYFNFDSPDIYSLYYSLWMIDGIYIEMDNSRAYVNYSVIMKEFHV